MKKVIHKIRQTLAGSPSQADPAEIKTKKIQTYLSGARIPWSEGYDEYRWQEITKSIHDSAIHEAIRSKTRLPNGFGQGLDERIAEYSWVLSCLPEKNIRLLDAGSTLNFSPIIEHPKLAGKDLFIATFFPEKNNFTSKRISYLYCDLRDIPLRDNTFEFIVSQSTLEHIGMDNSIYGYTEGKVEKAKVYEYLPAVQEYLRILKNKGELLLTFPYGLHENHGFFQQFDEEMLNRIIELLNQFGKTELTFFKYHKTGWQLSHLKECADSFSYNPHSGRGKADDGAAHSRAICCIRFVKSKI